LGTPQNGGTSFIQEVRVTGISNAMWGYSSTGVLSKVANNTLTTYGINTRK